MFNSQFPTQRTVFDAITFSFLSLVVAVFVLIPSQDQQLEMGRNFLFFLIFFIFGSGLSFYLNKLGIKTWGEQIFEPPHLKAKNLPTSFLGSFWGTHMLVTLVVTFIVGVKVTDFSLAELGDQDGFAGALRLFQGLLSPNLSLLPKAILNIVETIFMAFMATALAIPMAFLLSFVCAKNIMGDTTLGNIIYLTLRTLLNVTRSIEALIWAIIFSVWVGIGPFAGMLALMIHSIASLAKQYSEMVESVEDGPIEGIRSTGANKIQTIWYAIVPQVILPYISFTVYRWDINVRMATVIGLVGGGGIGTMLIQYQGQAMWPEVGCIILVIATVVWLLDQASAHLRQALK